MEFHSVGIFREEGGPDRGRERGGEREGRRNSWHGVKKDKKTFVNNLYKNPNRSTGF